MDLQEIEKISEGNGGALTILKNLVTSGYKDRFEIIRWLDEQGHTGEKMWMLYKDVYGYNIDKMVRAIRTDIDNQTMKKIGMSCPGRLI